jgi:hypothetical protein
MKVMKYIRILLVFLAIAGNVNAQAIQTGKTKGLPPFSIQLTDGTIFKSTDLQKNKPVMIIYFDPDCDHCHAFLDKLLPSLNLFRNDQIVLVTYVPVQKVKEYVDHSDLSKYPQLKIGTEGGNYTIRYFYDVVQFPYVALHDAKGNLIKTYESIVAPVEQLAAELK